jgi:5'-nucleotidase
MHIVVTNDDGVVAPGLLALAMEMRKLGTVSILAPDRNWSASGHVRTLDRPLRVREVVLSDTSTAWACDGAPSDCVALALCGFFSDPVDLVVSGINPYIFRHRNGCHGSCHWRAARCGCFCRFAG